MAWIPERSAGQQYNGLRNQGATCYLNTVLQCLYMTEDFRREVENFGSDSQNFEEEGTKLMQELQKLFKMLKECNGTEGITEGITQCLRISNVHEQQDAVEYFQKTLNIIRPQMSKIFEGELKNNIRCLSDSQHKREEKCSFFTIPLSIEQTSEVAFSVKQGFENFSNKVKFDSLMYCEHCCQKAEAETWSEIEEFPTILTLYLKRFHFDYYHRKLVKDHSPVDIPLQLHIGNCKYELYAVINHIGVHNGGHYNAVIKSFEDNEWYSFDDSSVIKKKREDLETSLHHSFLAYLLMYRKLEVDVPHHNQSTNSTNSGVQAGEFNVRPGYHPTDVEKERGQHHHCEQLLRNESECLTEGIMPMDLDVCKEQQKLMAYMQTPEESATSQMRQPSLPTVVEVHQKYDNESQDVKRLNRAVAEFICLDEVPVYIVEGSGFRNLVQQLDRKYDMPGGNHFIYNEIPKLYTETRDVIQSQLAHQPFFSCTTDIWTSRTADAYMAVTIHYITESWETQSWCLGTSALYSDHTADSLHEVLEEMVSEKWGLDLSKMTSITTNSAFNNKLAFENYTWIPCFGHNLQLAVGKALGLTRVSSVLTKLRKTVSAFSRSNKLMRNLKEKQETLNLPVQNLVHDDPTHWNSTFEMVDRFCIQQKAVSAILDEHCKWQLMPKESEVATLEIIRNVLAPLSSFVALVGEKNPTLSSVLLLKWKLLSFLTVKDGESRLSCEMKEKIKIEFTASYESRPLNTVLNIATFLDPRFKDSFVAMEDEVKAVLSKKSAEASQQQTSLVQQTEHQQQEDHRGAKKIDFKSLLFTIKYEKSVVEAKGPVEDYSTSPANKLTSELCLYKKMTEISAYDDPLTWWKVHETTMPTLAHFARQYLCIPASSCTSEHVFSTTGHIRLTEENTETLVFLANNLQMAKELSRK